MFAAGLMAGSIITLMVIITCCLVALHREDLKQQRKRKYMFQIMEHKGRRVKIADFVSASKVLIETDHYVYEEVKFKDLKQIKARTKIYRFENYKGERPQ